VTPAEASALAWEVGGDVMVVLGPLIVYLVGLAVMGLIRR
jgi:hypothetical protein